MVIENLRQLHRAGRKSEVDKAQQQQPVARFGIWRKSCSPL